MGTSVGSTGVAQSRNIKGIPRTQVFTFLCKKNVSHNYGKNIKKKTDSMPAFWVVKCFGIGIGNNLIPITLTTETATVF